MVSNTKEFTFKRKKDSKVESLRIVPDDPSNIFEFSYVKNTKKTKISKDPVKVINFDEFLFTDFRKLDFGSKKNIFKGEKMKDVNVASIENGIKVSKKTVEDIKKKRGDMLVEKSKLNEIYNPISEPCSLDDLLIKILDELSKKNSSEYLNRIKEVVRNKEVQESEDINELEMKSKKVELEILKWLDIKEKVLPTNALEKLNLSLITPKKEESTDSLFESSNSKILDKINKINFLKNSIKCCTKNLSVKVCELEKKIYNLTTRDEDLDPMVILKAITRSK